MTEFSPVTQAVLDAFRSHHTGQGCLAAALRALTRTSLAEEAHICGWFCSAIRTEDILAIAAELE